MELKHWLDPIRPCHTASGTSGSRDSSSRATAKCLRPSSHREWPSKAKKLYDNSSRPHRCRPRSSRECAGSRRSTRGQHPSTNGFRDRPPHLWKRKSDSGADALRGSNGLGCRSAKGCPWRALRWGGSVPPRNPGQGFLRGLVKLRRLWEISRLSPYWPLSASWRRPRSSRRCGCPGRRSAPGNTAHRPTPRNRLRRIER